ncbi:MAG: hypothetical protein OXU53_07975, partial [Deltaproteobacteria bacterium]|nr:hypothetical protein [Deltaproteobacteria bacterium]
LSGTLDASSWAVTGDDPDGDGQMTAPSLDVTSVAVLGSDGNPVADGTARPAEGSTPAVTPTISESDGRMTLLITHGALASTASTPTVQYTMPAGASLLAGGEAIGTTPAPVEAADGVPPTMSAQWNQSPGPHRSINVSFSEDVQAAPGKTEPVPRDWFVDAWNADGERITVAVTAPSYSLATGRITISVSTAGSPSIDDIDITRPVTLRLDVPDGEANDNRRGYVADRADAPNAIPDPFTAPVHDREAPAFTVRTATAAEEALVGATTDADRAGSQFVTALMTRPMEAADFASTPAGAQAQWSLARGDVSYTVTSVARAAAAPPVHDRVIVRASQPEPDGFFEIVAPPGPLVLTYTAGAAPLTGANGVAMASPTRATLAAVQAPDPFDARTQSLTQTVVTFDGGSLSGTLDTRDWRVSQENSLGAQLQRDVTSVAALDSSGDAVAAETARPAAGATPAVTPTISASDDRTSLLITHAPLTGTGVRPDVSYVSEVDNLSEGSQPVASTVTPVRAADGAPPGLLEATLDSATSVTVELTEGVTGMTAIPEWTVEGATISLITAGTATVTGTSVLEIPASTDVLEIALEGTGLGDGATPDVEYTAPTGLNANSILDEADTPNEMRSSSVEARDAIAPRILSAAFDGPTAIDVTFSEPVRTSGDWTVVLKSAPTTTLTVDSADEGSTPSIVLLVIDTATPPQDMSVYTVSAPATLVDRATDPNTVDADEERDVTYTVQDTTPPTFTVTTESVGRFSVDVRIAFSEPVFLATGKELPVATDWLMEVLTRDGLRELRAPTRTVTWAPAEPTETISATSVTLRHARQVAPESVAFSPEAENRRGSLVDGNGNALSTAAVRAGAAEDTTAPRLLSARLVSATEMRATFSEDVRLTSAGFDASDWASAGTTFTDARATGEQVVLTVARSGATSVADGATLSYTGDSVTDAAGNPAPSATGQAAPALVDGAPPAATSV